MRTTTLAAGALACTAVVLGAAPAMAAAPASASSAAKTPACATSQLTASLGGSDAGAGNLYRYLLLTNHSGTTCDVAGFPGLSLLDSHGKEIGAPAVFDHNISYTAVAVRPGQTVSDTIHTLNSGATPCQGTSTSLRIYPPANKAALVIPGKVMLCGNQLSVSPFAAGTTGNPSNSGTTVTPISAASGSPTPAPSSGGGAGSGTGASAAPATPTPSSAGSGTGAAPASSASPASGQVGVVPSGAPDTGVPPIGGSSNETGLIAGACAIGAALLGGAGFMLRRRSQARG
ncbi:DUF4232 domain-containing protein [Streptacidiphilus sp. PB12-B1b]|uniref:DUF4232 domain-containing protein n=1 Tax=Streptacidiphilus sp. PB12-B1b TaxID=2705012 RepID=UPI0015FDA503|nr:DUF4232 domain-containing protein [Streptacidiphilus sp. PB12-B1b]QMU75034.1 DUF4232 domain-containing protein [Streptacidiphilus sp. PB12-B1b]